MENFSKLIKKLRNDLKDSESFINSDKNKYDAILKNDFKDLYDKYTSIFDLIRNNTISTIDIERLEFMFSMSQKVKDNKVTEHNASVEVGQRLVDDIVKPQLNE